jgi:hypothetical protein
MVGRLYPVVCGLVIAGLAAQGAPAGETFVWWEAEAAAEDNFAGPSGFGPKTLDHPQKLSGGDWLHTARSLGHWARYEITVPRTDEYEFWVRKFWYYGTIRWRFDEAPWQHLKRQALRDSVTLRRIVPAQWVRLGTVKLTEGTHRFRFETTEDYRPDGPAAFDCFVLSAGAFEPRGKLKPGESAPFDVPGWFAFDPPSDAFTEDALLDLRWLNHAQSGEKGHLRTRGSHLVWEAEPEKPVRLWGTHIGPGGPTTTHAQMDRTARRLAKAGCNIARMHTQFWWKDKWAPKSLEIPDEFLDRFNYMVYTLKANGVYLMLNTYYDHFFSAAVVGLPGYTDAQKQAHSPHFFFIHPEGRRIWRSWVKRLLDAHNPYTGMRNVEDPTIAIVQLVNEDNYLFWTFSPYGNIPAPVMHVLEERFADWLRRRYGSLDEARRAWGNAPSAKGDDFANGRVGLYSVWNLTEEAGRKGARKPPQRFYDQAQFLTEDMRRVLGEMQAYLKEDLGYKGLVNGTNWLTADPRVLEPLDKYAAMVCDVMDRHGVGWYAPAKLKQSWSMNKGDVYQDAAALRHPERMPVTDIQYAGKPHAISEPKCAQPNRFRTSWFPFMAAYGLLQGTDAITHFSGAANWARSYGRWTLGTPVHIGQSPATALIFRRQYVQPGPVVVREALALADLYRLEGAAVQVAAGMDEMTQANVPEGGQAQVDSIDSVDPLAIFVGQVVRAIGETPGKSVIADLRPYIDREHKIIRSATGELVWSYGVGFLTIHAPKARGVVGFLAAAGPKTLGNVTVDGGNEYGSILLVPLDDRPLEQSARILLQVASEDTNCGWKTEPVHEALKPGGPVVQAKRLLDTGGSPVIARDLAGTVTLRRPDADELKVTALDFNGYPQRELPGGKGNALTIRLLPDVLYYVIHR